MCEDDETARGYLFLHERPEHFLILLISAFLKVVNLGSAPQGLSGMAWTTTQEL